MLVEQSSTLPEGDGWEYEISWAGERVFASKHGDKVRIVAVMHRRDLTNRFPVVAAAMARLRTESVVLDGTIRPLEVKQLAAFGERPPEVTSSAATPIRFIASDLLWLGDDDVRRCTFVERRERLRALIADSGLLAPLHASGSPAEMLAQGRQVGAEALIAKRCDSKYRPYARAGDWLRVLLATRPEESSTSPGSSDSGVPFGHSDALGFGQLA